MSADSAASALAAWNQLDKVFGLNFEIKTPLRITGEKGVVPSGSLFDSRGEEVAPDEIKHLLMQRMEARKTKDFKRADSIRDELKAKGWVIEDTPKGPKLKKI
jgi:cysteinyl-tRNA synthetase